MSDIPSDDTSSASATTKIARLQDELRTHSYAPSWIDRFIAAIDRLPGPSWPYYIFIGLVPVAAMVLAKWVDGTYTPPYVSPFHVAVASAIAYVPATIAMLDHVAHDAMATFRPASTLNEEQYKTFEYQLTTLPSRPALLWTIVPLVLGILGTWGASAVLLDPAQLAPEVQRLALFTSPLSSVIDGLTLTIWYPLLGIWYYHTYHQLKIVDELYIGYTEINPFYLKPLYAFSRLTAYTAISLIIPVYGPAITIPGSLEDPVFLGDTVVLLIISILAIAIFVWPLLGIHRLLVAEKEKLVASSAKRIESAIAEFDRRIDAGELQDMDVMKDTMDALATKQALIDHIPTWPWSTETSRLLATAITLPIVLYIIQRMIEVILRP